MGAFGRLQPMHFCIRCRRLRKFVTFLAGDRLELRCAVCKWRRAQSRKVGP